MVNIPGPIYNDLMYVPFIMAVFSKYTSALTFQNFSWERRALAAEETSNKAQFLISPFLMNDRIYQIYLIRYICGARIWRRKGVLKPCKQECNKAKILKSPIYGDLL